MQRCIMNWLIQTMKVRTWHDQSLLLEFSGEYDVEWRKTRDVKQFETKHADLVQLIQDQTGKWNEVQSVKL